MRELVSKGEIMKKRRSVLALLLVAALTVVLGGCQDGKDGKADSSDTTSSQVSTESTPTGEPVMGGSITVGIPQDIEDSLDPHKSVAAGTKEILFNIYEGLVKPDEEGNLNDAVAESHSISEDGKVYTFKLRNGVKFHDGTTVTAEDTEFLAYLTVAIVPEHVEDLEADPVGTGPFHYVSRSPQENIVLEKFSDYWDTENQAYLDKVTFRIVKDSNAVVTNLKSGTLDMYARLSSTQTAQLAEDSDFTIYDGGMNLVQALYLNNAVEPLNNVKVRQALCYAANRQEVLDMIADGKGTIIGSSMFPAFGKYYVPELSERYNQDIEKAKELLKEAGYPDGFELTITVPNNYQQHIDTAQVLVEQLKAIGVTAKIQQVEWDSWLSDVYADRKFQSTVVGVDAAYLTGRALLERFTSTSSKNFINYSNEEYDKLYQQVKTSTDEEEQVELYKKMETLLCDDAANLYIEDMACEVALRSDFAGYRFYPLYVQDMTKIYKVK